MNDLLISGVRLAVAGRLSEPVDLQVSDGRIREIRPAGGPLPPGVKVIDGAGDYLSPGWIDLHAHVYPGVSEIGLDPDAVGLRHGVHLVVDAGSAGSTTLPGFRDYVVVRSQTQVLALLNISAMGLVVVKGATELPDLRWVHLAETVAIARAHRHLIRGIKVRASGLTTGHLGLEPLRLAIQAAEACDLPVMVHIGETPPELSEVLDLLRQGDMVTHCFHGKEGGILGADGELIPAMRRALDRGVRLDIGHGAASYSMAVARQALALGVQPDVISTDIHVRSAASPVRDLATTMTKLLTCGMPLAAVIQAVTEHPAQWLREPGFDSLEPGSPARLTLFRLEESPLQVKDASGTSETVHQWIRPLAALTPEGMVSCG